MLIDNARSEKSRQRVPIGAFIVLWLLAFQNGFFWQTVLKREGERKSASDERQ